MNEYKISINIIDNVLAGKNMQEVFNKNIESYNNLNTPKIKDICYGVFRYYYTINSILNILFKNKPENTLYIILLIAIYEISYTKKPQYAITNDLVNITFELTKNLKYKNFINAVIRNFLRKQSLISKDIENKSEVKYNFSLWFIDKVKNDYPKDYESILNSLIQKPKLTLRINNKKTSLDYYCKVLTENKLEYEIIKDAIILDNISVNNIPLFQDGYVSIQDINAQQLKTFCNFQNNLNILDACAAPGGKTCQVLENSIDAKLLAIDIDKNRLDKVKENLSRLNLTANLACADASILNWWDGNKFDIVITDVPCSATGTLKKNPDIKIHRQQKDIKNFVETQRKIVINLWNIVKNQGFLVYITCSIFKEENQDNIQFFLQKLKNVKFVKELSLLPDNYGDGFYYCLLQKIGE